jgi:hypothetical protein
VSAPSPQHVQALIDQAEAEFKQTTATGVQMVTKYGSDPTKWGSGHWKNGMGLLAQARAEAGQLLPPPAQKLQAGFTSKEG